MIQAKKSALIVGMALGSVAMWVGAPVFWLFVASQLSSASQITLTTIIVAMVGIPVSMIAIAKGLARLDEVYRGLAGAQETAPLRSAWLRSMRDDRDGHRERTVLDVVMVTSVLVALALFGLWFLFFAKGGGI